MTTPEPSENAERAEQTGQAVPAEPWRPSRRAKITALMLAVLLVVGVTGGLVVLNHNLDAPVDAVREYVDVIARGDAATANRLVDPRRLGADVDPKLLTDEVLRSAKQRIEVGEVDLASENIAADVVDVRVEYRLGAGYRANVLLRAQRTGATVGVLDEWRVIDPLLVPVRVESNEPRLDTASLGAATIPVGGPTVNDWPERPVFVYPGVYELRGHESRYLTAEPSTLAVVNQYYDERPPDALGRPVRGSVFYRATPDLVAVLNDRLVPYVNACAAAAPRVPRDCPAEMRLYADFATDFRIARRPRIESVQSYQVEPGEGEPSLRMRAADGSFSYLSDGEHDTEPFLAYATIVVTPADELTITFTPTL